MYAAYPQTAVSCGYPTFTPHTLIAHDSYPAIDPSLATPPNVRGNVVLGPNGLYAFRELP